MSQKEYKIKPTLEIADKYFEFISDTRFVWNLKEIAIDNNISDDDIVHINNTVTFPFEVIHEFRENLIKYLPTPSATVADDLFFVIKIISAYCREILVFSSIISKLEHKRELYFNNTAVLDDGDILFESEPSGKHPKDRFIYDLYELIGQAKSMKKDLIITRSADIIEDKNTVASVSLPLHHPFFKSLEKQLYKLAKRKPKIPEENSFKRKLAHQLKKYIDENLSIKEKRKTSSLIGFILGETCLEISDDEIKWNLHNKAIKSSKEKFERVGVSLSKDIKYTINEQEIKKEIKRLLKLRESKINQLLKTPSE